MKQKRPNLEGKAVAEHFGRAGRDRWTVMVWPCPLRIGTFSYSMHVNGVAIGEGLIDFPLLHGRFESVDAAMIAGKKDLFARLQYGEGNH